MPACVLLCLGLELKILDVSKENPSRADALAKRKVRNICIHVTVVKTGDIWFNFNFNFNNDYLYHATLFDMDLAPWILLDMDTHWKVTVERRRVDDERIHRSCTTTQQCRSNQHHRSSIAAKVRVV